MIVGQLNNKLPAITAVVVTYNSKGHVGNALDALSVAHGDGCLECVVVDNASVDGTADFVADMYPWVVLERSATNLGFGRGCNLGFQKVRTPYVLIHNPDLVIDCQALRALVSFIESHLQADIVAPAIRNEDGSLQFAGMITTPESLFRTAFGFSKARPQQRLIDPGGPPFQTPWVCGAAMLIRAELFARLGGFDPRFFLYFEETDFCRRALEQGSEIWAVGQAVAKHLGGACAKATGQKMVSSCIAEHFYQSRFYYLVKHFGWFQAAGVELLVWILEKLRILRNYLIGRHGEMESRSKGCLLRLPAPPEDRI